MSTYTFACLNCDVEFDKNVSYDDIDTVICKECGYKTRRVYTFKGLVWSPTRNSGLS